jgi:hypothetical protein
MRMKRVSMIVLGTLAAACLAFGEGMPSHMHSGPETQKLGGLVDD